jgi:zinc ribbon protein
MDSTSTLEAPTTDLTAPLATTNSDRCPSCGTQMAADQRYCINCGERRTGGGLRDALPRTQAAVPATTSPPRPRWSPNTSLIAGVATLLLALGVGVLIGRAGDNGTSKAAAPQVVTVSAGSAGTAGAGGAATTAAASTSSTAKSAAAKRKAKHAARAKIRGTSSVDATAKKNGVKLPPKVVKVGQKCEQGAKGCQGGKFTGNFFGGG